MKHIKTLNTREYPQSVRERQKGRLRRMPDVLPVRLQDQLRHCQSAVREQKAGEQIIQPVIFDAA